jgi:putative ABC transport system permease protein
MKRLRRFFGRAPARIIASVVAIALAVGAIGVFAVPDVAADSLRRQATADRLTHVAADTTELDSVDGLDIEGATAVEGRVSRTVAVGDDQVMVIGLDFDHQQANVVGADEGTLPGPGEILVTEGVAEVGDMVDVGSDTVTVVGVGGTTWWTETGAVFADLDTARALTGVEGFNRVLVRMDDSDGDSLDAAVDDLRVALADRGATFESFPITVPDGRHPIEDDLRQISTMIGLLGVVAGVVALVLLASTTNTLITERTREVAVMRALGAGRRSLRRRLRGLALGIAAVGGVLGLALGVVVANYLARMVLERFVGVTPGLAVSWPVMAASAVFALGGAWLVSGRAARRVTRVPLAEALRDRDATPFGRRVTERLATRLPTGGLIERMAVRSALHRRARTMAVLAQLTAGVAAVIVVASLSASVQGFNEAELEPWRWASSAQAVDAGLPYDAGLAADREGVEPFIGSWGLYDDWEVGVFGVEPDTAMIDHRVRVGRWLDGGRGVVISAGFADAQGIEVGDEVSFELASGPHRYAVVGLHRSRSRDVYVPRELLAADLGAATRVNAFWSLGPADELEASLDLPALAEIESIEAVAAEDAAARKVIADLFIAIGAVVVGVSMLGVSSAMAVNLWERRQELAAFQALGADRSRVRRLLVTELVPLALVASAAGAVAGWFGAQAIIASFESADAVEIGTVFAARMVPLAAAACTAIVVLIGVSGARRAARRPVAPVLRGAA